MKNPSNPFISVIIPVFNDLRRLKLCLDALKNQAYPKDLYEIIVIDNGSAEDIKSVVDQFSGVVFDIEKKRSSYAARNKGISLAKGEIIAFTDSDCIPEPDWISEGISAIITENADLAGGRVQFFYSERKTAAEIYDSVTNLQAELAISRGVCQTANLFVKAPLFNKVGLFPMQIKSGGDTQWTKRATKSGFQLIYVPKAIVKHPTSKLRILLKKHFRYGTGTIPYFISQNESTGITICRILKSFLPTRPSTLRKRIDLSGIEEAHKKFWKLWGISLLCIFPHNFGKLLYIFRLLRKKLLKRKNTYNP